MHCGSSRCCSAAGRILGGRASRRSVSQTKPYAGVPAVRSMGGSRSTDMLNVSGLYVSAMESWRGQEGGQDTEAMSSQGYSLSPSTPRDINDVDTRLSTDII